MSCKREHRLPCLAFCKVVCFVALRCGLCWWLCSLVIAAVTKRIAALRSLLPYCAVCALTLGNVHIDTVQSLHKCCAMCTSMRCNMCIDAMQRVHQCSEMSAYMIWHLYVEAVLYIHWCCAMCGLMLCKMYIDVERHVHRCCLWWALMLCGHRTLCIVCLEQLHQPTLDCLIVIHDGWTAGWWTDWWTSPFATCFGRYLVERFAGHLVESNLNLITQLVRKPLHCVFGSIDASLTCQSRFHSYPNTLHNHAQEPKLYYTPSIITYYRCTLPSQITSSSSPLQYTLQSQSSQRNRNQYAPNPLPRKTHLFDIDIPGKISFFESDTLTPGDKLTIVDMPFGPVGLGICYDIRFPEMALIY